MRQRVVVGMHLALQQARARFGRQLAGQPIGAGPSFLREIVHSLANQIVYLSFLWMLWDANRQTLADLVVKSNDIVVPKS